MAPEREGKHILTTILLPGGVPLHQFKDRGTGPDTLILGAAVRRRMEVSTIPQSVLFQGLPQGEIRRLNLTRMSREEAKVFLYGDWRMLALQKVITYLVSNLLNRLSIQPSFLRGVQGSSSM